MYSSEIVKSATLYLKFDEVWVETSKIATIRLSDHGTKDKPRSIIHIHGASPVIVGGDPDELMSWIVDASKRGNEDV